jgi:toxin FitB
VSFLLDTNVVSELRKAARGNPQVAAWFRAIPNVDLYTSVVVIAELRRGIERLRRHDVAQALRLETWFSGVRDAFGARILPITTSIAEEWGRINVPDPLPILDGLLVATARVHGLTLVTRDASDLRRRGFAIFNPWAAG